ncbi:MAG: type III pantothenate kinase [Defluviitaleaceae bacterium]|nr:type III pantothenate kinase [Defluviitaleaceae bacterium]
MLLVVDVGNTNMVLGLYDGPSLLRSWRMGTRNNQTSDEMGAMMRSWLTHEGAGKGILKNAIISSVVPDIMYSLTNAIRKYFDITPMIVSGEMKLGVELKIATRKLGADRIVNCVAAFHKFGGPVIIIDYGTATTYDAMDASGGFVTGITAPGIKISADALFERAALLGKVELNLPPSVIVKTTTESVQAGILYGAIGQTKFIVDEIKQAMGGGKVTVVATGGLVQTISVGTKLFDHIEPRLTLEGLRMIFDMNAGE